MPKSISLPDGSYFPLKDNETSQSALYAAINAYPQLFYVDSADKCGNEVYYTPLQLPKGGYACGFIAYEKNISATSSTSTSTYNTVRNLESPNLGTAFSSAAIASIIGFGIAYYLHRKIKSNYEGKAQKILLMIILFSVGIGLSGITNELLSLPLQGTAIRVEKIIQFSFANIIVFPLILFALLHLFKPKNKVQSTNLSTNTHRHNDSTKKFTEDNSSPNKASSETDAPSKPKTETTAITPSDIALNRLFAIANEELESNNKDKGLWARCFAESNGNTNVATAKYLNARVSELAKMESQKSNIEKEEEFLSKQRGNNNDESKSLFDLATILSKGNGEFTKDLKSAFDKMEKSALLGYGRAQYNVSLMYWKGEGVAINTSYAYAWCLIASEKEIDAISNIQFMKSKMTDSEMAQGESIAQEIKDKIKKK